MFKSRTVFILGAGASIPYGFPSGYQLVTDIINNLFDESKCTILRDISDYFGNSPLQFKHAQLESFRISLSKSPVQSIDDFLEARKEYLNVGKALIAQTLIPYEDEKRLFTRTNNENWYSMIFEVLRKDINNLRDKQISFITFNYDRSLEHYLFTQLKEFLNLQDKDCKTVMNKIPIIHVYGHLGYLDWQDYINFRRYQPNEEMLNIISGMTHLSVIHESNQANDNFIEAQQLIQRCDKIRFLGYGFHDTNTERLEVVEQAAGKDIRATSYGLSKLQKRNIVKQFEHLINLDKEERRDIVRYFKEEVTLE